MNGLDGQRPLWLPLLAWLVGAAVAVAAAQVSMALCLAVATSGGVVFGWLSARREDARRIAVRRRRVRSLPMDSEADGDGPGHEE